MSDEPSAWKHVSGLAAVGSVVLAVTALVGCFGVVLVSFSAHGPAYEYDSLLVIPALVSTFGFFLGVTGLRQAKQCSRGQKTRRWAIGGMVASGVVLLLTFLTPALLEAAFAPPRDESAWRRCPRHLEAIGRGANMWLFKFGDNKYFPSSLRSLVDDGIITDAAVLLCPDRRTHGSSHADVSDYVCILELVGRKVTEQELTSSTPLAWDKAGSHHDGRNVVFADSHVEFIVNEKWPKVQAQIDAWVAEHTGK